MSKLTFILLFISAACMAQQEAILKIAAQTSKEDLKKNLYYLASEKLQGRLMGSHGDTLASEYVAQCFKANHIEAAYNNGSNYYQAVATAKKQLQNAVFAIGNKQYENWDGWSFPLAGTEITKLENIPVVFAGYGIEDSRYNDFSGIDVKGKAVLIITGQPKDNTGKYFLSGTNQPAPVAAYQRLLKDKGAVAILVCNYRFAETALQQKKRLFLPVYKNELVSNTNLPQFQLSEERVNELLAGSQTTINKLQAAIDNSSRPQSFEVKNTVSIHIQIDLQRGTAPNVIGVVKGTDSEAGCIILSAHHDHDGTNGSDIYFGAVDNASGTVAIMEIARLMDLAVKGGWKPKRSIVFASYTGEERGLLGSFYFAANPLYPIEKTRAVLNIDMMGRVDTFYSGRRADSNYAYILVKDTLNRGLRTALYSANESVKLKLDTYYEQPQFMQRRLTGSDQYPFFLKGVPFIRIDCGFSKDYHQLTDTPDKINYELLSKQVQLAFLTVWNMANGE